MYEVLLTRCESADSEKGDGAEGFLEIAIYLHSAHG